MTDKHSPSSQGGGPNSASPEPEDLARIQALEAEIADLTAQLAQCGQEVKEVMTREAAGGDSLAGEIHRLKQRKMVLTTEIQHRKVLINAILLGG